MSEPIAVTILANAGVGLTWRNTKLLVDVLEDAGPYAFSKPPGFVLDQMMEGAGEWSNADYLVFSHEHPDHFTPELLKGYLFKNKVKRMVLPNSADGENQKLLLTLKEKRAPVWLLPREIGGRHSFVLEKDIVLHTVTAPHTGNMFENASCTLLLFSIDGRNILFLSDCDERHPEFYSWLDEVKVDLAFVNPFFFASLKGQEILKTHVQAKKAVIYHVPEEQDDQMKIRAVVKQAKAKFGRGYPGLEVADKNLYTLESL